MFALACTSCRASPCSASFRRCCTGFLLRSYHAFWTNPSLFVGTLLVDVAAYAVQSATTSPHDIRGRWELRACALASSIVHRLHRAWCVPMLLLSSDRIGRWLSACAGPMACVTMCGLSAQCAVELLDSTAYNKCGFVRTNTKSVCAGRALFVFFMFKQPSIDGMGLCLSA